jgi:hypothetical protein
MQNNRTILLSLPTQSKLLRTRFSAVRRGLAGRLNTKSVVVSVPVQTQTKARVKSKSFLKSIIDKAALAAIVLAVLVGLILLIPQVYYAFTPVDTVPVQTAEQKSVLGGSFEEGTSAIKQEEKAYQPPKDETLPEGDWLVIPRIGVRTQLLETAQSEEALSQGVWKVPGYGEAGSTDLPVILAAHRFGWEWWWQSDYWKYNSFYLLPDTEPGDTIEIISDQRKWVYEIYGGAEGDAIADYEADLILYTCKFLNAPVRHFRYARLLDPTVDTQ